MKVRPNVSVRAADDYNGHRQWSDDGRTPFSLQSVVYADTNKVQSVVHTHNQPPKAKCMQPFLPKLPVC